MQSSAVHSTGRGRAELLRVVTVMRKTTLIEYSQIELN